MRKLLLLIFSFSLLNSVFAAEIAKNPPLRASEVFLPVGIAGQQISIMKLSKIKIKELETLRGDKMSLKDRLGFKIAQKKLRDNIAPDGSFNSKAIKKAFGDGGFHLGGFALGFFLSLLGVLIAYLINDDNKSSRVWSAWRGFIAGFLISVAIVAAIAA